MTGLRQLQHDLEGRIRSCPAFADVGVVVVTGTSTREQNTFREQIEKLLAGIRTVNGKSGLCIVIPQPSVQVREPNLPGPQLSVTCKVDIVEDSIINRGEGGTELSADEAAMTLLSLIGDGWMARPWLTFIPDTEALEELAIPEDMAGDVAWRLNFRLELGLTPFGRVPTPTLTLDDGDLTMACGDAEAAIWFTTDDSFPWPGNVEATEYSAPFTPPAGVTIRAAAYRTDTDLAGSDCAEMTIPEA